MKIFYEPVGILKKITKLLYFTELHPKSAKQKKVKEVKITSDGSRTRKHRLSNFQVRRLTRYQLFVMICLRVFLSSRERGVASDYLQYFIHITDQTICQRVYSVEQ